MFITNFDNKDLPKYKRAIADFKAKTGSDRLYIKDVGYDCDGGIVFSASALHDKVSGDLSVFWRLFEAINIVTDKDMFENMQYYMEYCEQNDYVTPMEWIEKHKHF